MQKTLSLVADKVAFLISRTEIFQYLELRAREVESTSIFDEDDAVFAQREREEEEVVLFLLHVDRLFGRVIPVSYFLPDERRNLIQIIHRDAPLYRQPTNQILVEGVI